MIFYNNCSKGSLPGILSLGAGCVGRGSSWDLRIRPAAPAASGNLEIWEFWDLGTWKSRNVGSKNQDNNNNKRMEIQNPNPFCPKCRRGLDLWEKVPLAPFPAISGNFSMGRKNQELNSAWFSLMGQWAVFTQFGPLLLSTLGNATHKIGSLTADRRPSLGKYQDAPRTSWKLKQGLLWENSNVLTFCRLCWVHGKMSEME